MRTLLAVAVLAVFAVGCSTQNPTTPSTVVPTQGTAPKSKVAVDTPSPPTAKPAADKLVPPTPVTPAKPVAEKPPTSPQPPATKPAVVLTGPAVGQPIQKVIDASAGQRIQFFDSEGKAQKELPRGARGSVSVHTRDQTGQDNYTFDEKGNVTKHLRSYGDDYKKANWVEVK